MKHLLALLVLAACAATTSGQTIKSLGFNTTNGNVVYSGTNVLTFTNSVRLPFGGNSTNLALQFSTNATGFYVEGSGDQALVMVHNGSVAFGATANVAVFYRSISFSSTALATATRTNLSLGATWLTNTNVTNFRTAIGLGTANDVEFNSVGQGGGFRMDFGAGTIYDTDPTNVVFSFASGTWYVPISFSTNTLAAATRTNLGLPLPALTNTSNVTMMRALAGSTNTNQPFSGTFNTYDPVSEEYYTVTVSNGIIVSIPGL
jgi:hypothetical protein